MFVGLPFRTGCAPSQPYLLVFHLRRAALRRSHVCWFSTFGGLRSVAAGAEFFFCLRTTLAHSDIMSDALPQRRRPAHLPLQEHPGQSTIVLLTVCTDRRRPLLAHSEVAALIIDAWRQAQGWWVGRYAIMPDHLHAFCAPSGPEVPALAAWVKYWKTLVSRRWPRPAEQPIWQQGFWDRQLRSGEHYGLRWDYVRNNPVRHGLVPTAEAWPFQGELHEFRFRDA